eukprot:354219-Chlamydomonas_euryale.AAC.4
MQRWRASLAAVLAVRQQTPLARTKKRKRAQLWQHAACSHPRVHTWHANARNFGSMRRVGNPRVHTWHANARIFGSMRRVHTPGPTPGTQTRASLAACGP